MKEVEQNRILSNLRDVYAYVQNLDCPERENHKDRNISTGHLQKESIAIVKSLEEELEAPESKFQGRDSQDLVDGLHRAMYDFEKFQKEVVQQFLRVQREKNKKEKVEKLNLRRDILERLGTRKSKPMSSQNSGFHEDHSSFKSSEPTEINPRNQNSAAKTGNSRRTSGTPTPLDLQEAQEESDEVSEDRLHKDSDRGNSSSHSSELGSNYPSECRDLSQPPQKRTFKAHGLLHLHVLTASNKRKTRTVCLSTQ